MDDDLSEEEQRRYVRNFLNDFKELVDTGSLQVKGHIKTRETLLKLGLTRRHLEEEILSLSVSNYSSGPIEDQLHPGYLWVFGKTIDGVEVYIKLKIVSTPDNEYALCVSFHKAEKPLNYPFSK